MKKSIIASIFVKNKYIYQRQSNTVHKIQDNFSKKKTFIYLLK